MIIITTITIIISSSSIIISSGSSSSSSSSSSIVVAEAEGRQPAGAGARRPLGAREGPRGPLRTGNRTTTIK